jgi:hypothetical protein
MGATPRKENRSIPRSRGSYNQGYDAEIPDYWDDYIVTVYDYFCDRCGSYNCKPKITDTKVVDGVFTGTGIVVGGFIALFLPLIGIGIGYGISALGKAVSGSDKQDPNMEMFYCKNCGNEWSQRLMKEKWTSV